MAPPSQPSSLPSLPITFLLSFYLFLALLPIVASASTTSYHSMTFAKNTVHFLNSSTTTTSPLPPPSSLPTTVSLTDCVVPSNTTLAFDLTSLIGHIIRSDNNGTTSLKFPIPIEITIINTSFSSGSRLIFVLDTNYAGKRQDLRTVAPFVNAVQIRLQNSHFNGSVLIVETFIASDITAQFTVVGTTFHTRDVDMTRSVWESSGINPALLGVSHTSSASIGLAVFGIAMGRFELGGTDTYILIDDTKINVASNSTAIGFLFTVPIQNGWPQYRTTCSLESGAKLEIARTHITAIVNPDPAVERAPAVGQAEGLSFDPHLDLYNWSSFVIDECTIHAEVDARVLSRAANLQTYKPLANGVSLQKEVQLSISSTILVQKSAITAAIYTDAVASESVYATATAWRGSMAMFMKAYSRFLVLSCTLDVYMQSPGGVADAMAISTLPDMSAQSTFSIRDSTCRSVVEHFMDPTGGVYNLQATLAAVHMRGLTADIASNISLRGTTMVSSLDGITPATAAASAFFNTSTNNTQQSPAKGQHASDVVNTGFLLSMGTAWIQNMSMVLLDNCSITLRSITNSTKATSAIQTANGIRLTIYSAFVVQRTNISIVAECGVAGRSGCFAAGLLSFMRPEANTQIIFDTMQVSILSVCRHNLAFAGLIHAQRLSMHEDTRMRLENINAKMVSFSDGPRWRVAAIISSNEMMVLQGAVFVSKNNFFNTTSWDTSTNTIGLSSGLFTMWDQNKRCIQDGNCLVRRFSFYDKTYGDKTTRHSVLQLSHTTIWGYLAADSVLFTSSKSAQYNVRNHGNVSTILGQEQGIIAHCVRYGRDERSWYLPLETTSEVLPHVILWPPNSDQIRFIACLDQTHMVDPCTGGVSCAPQTASSYLPTETPAPNTHLRQMASLSIGSTCHCNCSSAASDVFNHWVLNEDTCALEYPAPHLGFPQPEIPTMVDTPAPTLSTNTPVNPSRSPYAYYIVVNTSAMPGGIYTRNSMLDGFINVIKALHAISDEVKHYLNYDTVHMERMCVMARTECPFENLLSKPALELAESSTIFLQIKIRLFNLPGFTEDASDTYRTLRTELANAINLNPVFGGMVFRLPSVPMLVISDSYNGTPNPAWAQIPPPDVYMTIAVDGVAITEPVTVDQLAHGKLSVILNISKTSRQLYHYWINSGPCFDDAVLMEAAKAAFSTNQTPSGGVVAVNSSSCFDILEDVVFTFMPAVPTAQLLAEAELRLFDIKSGLYQMLTTVVGGGPVAQDPDLTIESFNLHILNGNSKRTSSDDVGSSNFNSTNSGDTDEMDENSFVVTAKGMVSASSTRNFGVAIRRGDVVNLRVVPSSTTVRDRIRNAKYIHIVTTFIAFISSFYTRADAQLIAVFGLATLHPSTKVNPLSITAQTLSGGNSGTMPQIVVLPFVWVVELINSWVHHGDSTSVEEEYRTAAQWAEHLESLILINCSVVAGLIFLYTSIVTAYMLINNTMPVPQALRIMHYPSIPMSLLRFTVIGTAFLAGLGVFQGHNEGTIAITATSLFVLVAVPLFYVMVGIPLSDTWDELDLHFEEYSRLKVEGGGASRRKKYASIVEENFSTGDEVVGRRGAWQQCSVSLKRTLFLFTVRLYPRFLLPRGTWHGDRASRRYKWLFDTWSAGGKTWRNVWLVAGPSADFLGLGLIGFLLGMTVEGGSGYRDGFVVATLVAVARSILQARAHRSILVMILSFAYSIGIIVLLTVSGDFWQRRSTVFVSGPDVQQSLQTNEDTTKSTNEIFVDLLMVFDILVQVVMVGLVALERWMDEYVWPDLEQLLEVDMASQGLGGGRHGSYLQPLALVSPVTMPAPPLPHQQQPPALKDTTQVAPPSDTQLPAESPQYQPPSLPPQNPIKAPPEEATQTAATPTSTVPSQQAPSKLASSPLAASGEAPPQVASPILSPPTTSTPNGAMSRREALADDIEAIFQLYNDE